MDVTAVIPARMGASRYPGKPLCDIQGLSMVEHVYRRTAMSETVDETYVATPDEEIRDEVESFGGQAIMTGPAPRCVDRVEEAARGLDADIVIVMQGDEPLVFPDMIDDAVQPLLDDESVKVSNLAREIEHREIFEDPNTVKVTFGADSKALSFSREPIPHPHHRSWEEIRAFKQVCVIPFRKEFLHEFVDLPDTPLEQAEGIDMLRVLENGYDVHLEETTRDVHSVDTEADHERVNELMATDELYPRYAE